MAKPSGSSGEGRRSPEREAPYKALKKSVDVISAYFWSMTLFMGEKPTNREMVRALRGAQEAASKIVKGLGKKMTEAEAVPLIQTILDACATYRAGWESVTGKSGADIDRLKSDILELSSWVATRTAPIERAQVREPAEAIVHTEKVPDDAGEDGLELSDAFIERPTRSANSLEEVALREAKNVYLIREGQYFDAYELLRKRSAFGGLPRTERIAQEARNMETYQAYAVARETYIEKMRLSRGPKEAAALRAELQARDIQISSGIEQHVMPRFLTEKIEKLPKSGRTRISTTFLLALLTTGTVAADAVLIAATTPPLEPEHNDGRIWHATGRLHAQQPTNFVEIARQQAEAARRREPTRPYVPSPISPAPRPIENQTRVADASETELTPQVTDILDETAVTQTSGNLQELTADNGIGGPPQDSPSEP